MLTEQLKLELEQMAASGQKREVHARLDRSQGFIDIRGKKLVDFTNWDFLGLNEDARFRRALLKEIDQNGFGASSSRLSSGTTLGHITAEKRLAAFLSQQSALLFSSKNQALFTLLTALSNETDHIFYDEQLQAPAADLAYLVNAKCSAFNASNLSALNNELNLGKTARRKFIVAETVSPLSGRKLEIEQLLQIAARHQAFLLIDESHAIGNYGLRGAGLFESHTLGNPDLCFFGSLSYSLGCYGGFVAGSGYITNYLIHRSRTLNHEVSLPGCCGWAVASALEIVELAQKQRAILDGNVSLLRTNLSRYGFLDASQSDSAVVSIMIGSTEKSKQLANLLFFKGFLVDVVSLSTSFSDIGMLRLLVSVFHSPAQIEELALRIFELAGRLEE